MKVKRWMPLRAMALLIGWMSLAGAQETAVEEVSLRVLPLGNRAPFTQVIRDGARHEVDPPEGSLPPREVAVGIVVPDDAKTKPEEKLMRLRLGEGEVERAVVRQHVSAGVKIEHPPNAAD